jgi:hypothetical protein
MSSHRLPSPKKRSGTFRTGRITAPQSRAELDAMFPDDAACRRYLAGLRWPGAIACPWCGKAAEPTDLSTRALIRCGGCRMVSSPITSTLLDRSPIGLAAWFRGLWEIASRESGADPVRLSELLGVESSMVATWLLAVRDLFRAGWRDRLEGVVELARAPIEVQRGPGARPGVDRAVLAVAVEERGDAGRCRVERLERVDAASIAAFAARAVGPGSCLRTGSWEGYGPLRRQGYGHIPSPLGHDGELEQAQQVASLLRIWLWSNGHVTVERLPYYLDEFVFRFNARLRHSPIDRGALFVELLRLALQEPADRTVRSA